MVCLICLSGFAIAAAANGEVNVDPGAITGTLPGGGTQNAIITVTLPESVPRGDVVFSFDTTGSMGGILDAMKNQGKEVMEEIRVAIPDSRFGAISFMDYPYAYLGYHGYTCPTGACIYGEPSYGDYAYRVDQDLTDDILSAFTAIDQIPKGSGGDWPQDYTRVIYESQFLSWRTDAKKIYVIFGDAPPHAAPSGFTLMKPWETDSPEKLFVRTEAPYGGDPGRDEEADTADDLDYGPVVQDIAAQHIIIVAVYCPYNGMLDEGHRDAENNFRYLAYMTDGAFLVSDPNDDPSIIASQIVSMIQEMAKQNIRELTLGVREEGYREWVSSPDSYTDVPWPATRTFAAAITPPTGTEDGDYSFTIEVTGDGVVLGTVPVTLTVIGGQVVEPVMVSLDLKPGSCPNSFNPKEKGVLPAAILGSRELKVTDIDPQSLVLTREGGTVGVTPLRTSLEDVASPSDKTCFCGIQSGKEDRKKDLTLKFDSEELVKTLGITKDERCIRLTVTGVLRSSDPAVDGTPITGTDSLRVLNTGQGSCGKGDEEEDGSCDHGKDGDSNGDGGCDQDKDNSDDGDHRDGRDGDSHGDGGNGKNKDDRNSGDHRDGKDSSTDRGRD
ncbi:MAG: hypothetical protein LUO96_03635 [Methanomicrobiales archaeon]|nr:hypothetical protein [Methanomicrobiales archaeon]